MKPLFDAPLAIVDVQTTGAQALEDAVRRLSQLPALPAHIDRPRVVELGARVSRACH